jgi:cell division transport system permease protein
MSTTEPAQRANAREQSVATGTTSGMLPRCETPIVPKGTISGRALTGVIAIMTFLAALATGAVMLVRAAALDWQSEVAREVTIQVRAVAGRDIEADVLKATAIARAFPGISDVRTLSKAESALLLEPWLGTGIGLEELPVPRVVVVRLAAGVTPDLAKLRQTLTTDVPSATLDDHRGFVERMRVMARAAVIGGLGVHALVLIATILSVVFATRGAMATNRPVIEVLHLIGAKNSFIARHFQRHFLMLGLQGGLIGGGCASVLFGIAQFAHQWLPGDSGIEQFSALFGTFSIGLLGYAAVAGQVVVIAGVTALASRSTVRRTLDTIQ